MRKGVEKFAARKKWGTSRLSPGFPPQVSPVPRFPPQVSPRFPVVSGFLWFPVSVRFLDFSVKVVRHRKVRLFLLGLNGTTEVVPFHNLREVEFFGGLLGSLRHFPMAHGTSFIIAVYGHYSG